MAQRIFNVVSDECQLTKGFYEGLDDEKPIYSDAPVAGTELSSVGSEQSGAE
jgi:hypothetical protein